MPSQKYLTRKVGSTGLAEQAADAVGGTTASAGNIPALDATGRLPVTMMPVGVGPDADVIQASEALAAGAFVNIYNASGATRARNADGSTVGKRANGFVLAAAASGAQATVYGIGPNTQLSGLTPGPVWLSTTTPGACASTDAATTGQTSQYLGVAVSATEVNFNPGPDIQIA